MGHEAHHGHTHGPAQHDRAFAIGVILNLAFVGIEAGAGLIAGSLALLADAGHNLSDVLSLLLAWGASALARRPATARRTYGFRRATILASLLSAIVLLIAIGMIAWEAVQRFEQATLPSSATIMIVSGIGVVVNVGTAALFASGRHSDLNIKGAFLHMAADAAVSFGVLLAGVAIALTGRLWLDPLISLVIVALIAVGTWGLLRDSANLSLDAVPRHLDPDAIRSYLLEVTGVSEVHDLHVWAMSTTEAALTVHLVMPERRPDDTVLAEVHSGLKNLFGIEHSTVQVERGDGRFPCEYGSGQGCD